VSFPILVEAMQATDLFSQNPLAGPDAAERLAARVGTLGREIPTAVRERMLSLLAEEGRDMEALRDVLSTRLMEAFRDHKSRACFGLLYELNGAQLIVQVAGRLRRYSSQADPGDVLQEVFFNVYRYPHRFDSTREDAFRVWSAMIVRNTVLKHLRALGRSGRTEGSLEDAGDPEIRDDATPLAGVLQEEESRACSRAYVTYLQLYLRFYGMLSERERKALQLVEVDRVSYREAADALEVKLENLKMVIFRARRKIHRSMRRVFEGLPPDCRPTRGSDTRDEDDSCSAQEARR
jgi:RNA polymerase sigma factor (sigma-70 family)